MQWDLSELDYPQITINSDHAFGNSMWLAKVIEMTDTAQSKGPWDVLICDIWPNDAYSRLIGHVQMSDVSVGYDTGFRVCAYISKGGIIGDTDGGKSDTNLIKTWLDAAAQSDLVKAALTNRQTHHAFEIHLTSWGDGPIDKTPKITFTDNRGT